MKKQHVFLNGKIKEVEFEKVDTVPVGAKELEIDAFHAQLGDDVYYTWYQVGSRFVYVEVSQ